MAGPNTQNQYSPQAVQLDGGLDFINPKISIASGTLSACLNFERTDRQGYSRIFGYERFDGGMFPSLAYTNLVYIIHEDNLGTSPPRNEIWIVTDGTAGPVMGSVVDATDTKTLIAITNFDQWRLVLQAINAGDTIVLESEFGDSFTVSATEDFDTGYAASVGPAVPDAKDYTLARNEFFKSMDELVTIPGPTDKPVIGLHGYKDQLYAVKDLRVLYFTSGSEQIYGNDILHPDGSVVPDNDITVLDVHLLSGTYAGGDAAGTILTNTIVGGTNGDYDLLRPTETTDNVLTLSTPPGDVDMTAWYAGVWRSNDYDQSVENSVEVGWSPIDMGFSMGFEEGTANGPFRISRRGEFSNFTTDIIEGVDTGETGSTSDSEDQGDPVPGDTWTLSGGATIPDVLESDDTTSFIRRRINNSTPNNFYTPGNIYISDFPQFSGFNSSASLEVKGVEVTVVARPMRIEFDHIQIFSIAVQPVTNDDELQVGTESQTRNLVVNFDGSSNQEVQRLVFGGPTDLWGLDAATMKAALDSDWGMAIQPWVQILQGVRAGVIDIFYVQIKIYYTATVTDYYFWNGSDDVTADITSYFVTDGDWSSNDAEGNLQVTNIQAVGSSHRLFITDGDEIRTDPNGGGLLIATVTVDMVLNGLDTLAEIEAAKSRYQFIVANFYGVEEFEGLYGVSGAGRAFSWDGFYFNRIWTQEDEDKDKPRHITSHQFHLVLGYNAGAVLLSVAGNPQNFDGEFGATEIDTGDPIKGFARMSGTTLGIFCEKTIQGIVGTSIDNFSLNILSPYEGAIEYTICDVGKPIYCSYRGISLFDQTAAYGDFAGQRLSYAVTPFLAPRLQGLVSPLGAVAASSGPVVAVPCRTKNQYRLFFGDGYCLVMTLSGAQQTPIFTITANSMYDEDGEILGYFVPRAESSFVDSKGAERIHMAPYSVFTAMPAYYVYEFERSWTFDGEGIPAYVVTNDNFYGNLYDIDNTRKARLHGLSLGYAPLRVRVETDYDLNDTTIAVPREAVDVSMPRAPAAHLSYDYNPITNMGNIASRGRSFSYRFMSYDIETQPSSYKDPVYAEVVPPFVVQAMLVQNTENKGDV